jgi:hypothetical protein
MFKWLTDINFKYTPKIEPWFEIKTGVSVERYAKAPTQTQILNKLEEGWDLIAIVEDKNPLDAPPAFAGQIHIYDSPMYLAYFTAKVKVYDDGKQEIMK